VSPGKVSTYYYQRGKAYEARGEREHPYADFDRAKQLGP
jgi:hypothetical protein